MQGDFSFSLPILGSAETSQIFSDLSGMITSVVLMLLFFYLVFIMTRFIGKTAKNSINGRYITLREKVPLGMDKSLVLFELQGKCYVMYMDRNGAKLLDQRDDIDFPEDQESEHVDFTDVLRKFTGKKR